MTQKIQEAVWDFQQLFRNLEPPKATVWGGVRLESQCVAKVGLSLRIGWIDTARESNVALICWTVQLRLYLFSSTQQHQPPKSVSPK